MMEHKYRGWDIERKMMFTIEEMILKDSKVTHITRKPLEDEWSPSVLLEVGTEAFLLPYTGMIDKHGKEIYLGDLYIGQKSWCDGYLRKKYPKVINVICGVVFERGKFRGKEIRPTDEHKEADEEKHYRQLHYFLKPTYMRDNQNTQIEVIGNMYETPELLIRDKPKEEEVEQL